MYFKRSPEIIKDELKLKFTSGHCIMYVKSGRSKCILKVGGGQKCILRGEEEVNNVYFEGRRK